MYVEYADLYDQFYRQKDYAKEALFLKQVLPFGTILDVGCGTGNHMALLEKEGFQCTGIDINQQMLNRAQDKVKGPLFKADMIAFQLNQQFDAVISMFAVFNHNLTDEDALKTLRCFYNHLMPGGILLLDLYNPQKAGEKREKAGQVERIMAWSMPQQDGICLSHLTFQEEEYRVDAEFPLKIFSQEFLKAACLSCGFQSPTFYADYTLLPGTSQSKNLLLFTQKN